ncbi:MAG TPA: hypothetical protein VJN18_02980 [Polyangiaceae bacterium]|nr:hypothetical protein [Polyangiaceae bacterium]
MQAFRRGIVGLALLAAALPLPGCDDDNEGAGLSPAQQHGVGAACSADADCFVGDTRLMCLSFKGGYCGLEGCQQDVDCPAGSGCVTHDDGNNYCFLLCVEKFECNYTRPLEIEANCSSNITFSDGNKNSKACVPPS